ncbi:MAG: type II toxin-antitoxin system RelE/ParE family toxin [Bryobacteraceae bacterium]
MNPKAGDVIVGTGGARKVRFAGRSKGKSGGYRVITFFTGPGIPVFLLNVFAKNEKSTLTKKESAALKEILGAIANSYTIREVSG